jgi:gamma-glutamylcyclotransferase (GGCT)/AIG2-like uncharacterized protein YtfP
MNLFVYGTLRPDLGHPMALRLAAAGLALGPAWIEGLMYDLGEFPGVIAQPGAARVHGLLFALPATHPLWHDLDDYEDVRGGTGAFALETVRAWSCATDAWIDAVTYVYRGGMEGMPVVAGGDWASRSS